MCWGLAKLCCPMVGTIEAVPICWHGRASSTEGQGGTQFLV